MNKKADEICKKHIFDSNHFDCCIEMAEWKAKQAEKAFCELCQTSVDWHRSRTWGYNPHAEYRCWYDSKDDDYNFDCGKTESASGCGYDKLSQVLSYVFNIVARGMAYRKYRINKKKPFPYGIRLSDYNGVYFEGDIGDNCYRYGIAEYMGLKCTGYFNGKTYDHYVFEKKK